MHPLRGNGVRQGLKSGAARQVRPGRDRYGSASGSQGADAESTDDERQPSIRGRCGRFDGVCGIAAGRREITAQLLLMSAAWRQQRQADILVLAPGLLCRVDDPGAIRQPCGAAVRPGLNVTRTGGVGSNDWLGSEDEESNGSVCAHPMAIASASTG